MKNRANNWNKLSTLLYKTVQYTYNSIHYGDFFWDTCRTRYIQGNNKMYKDIIINSGISNV